MPQTKPTLWMMLASSIFSMIIITMTVNFSTINFNKINFKNLISPTKMKW